MRQMFPQAILIFRVKSLTEFPLVCHGITELINTNALITVEPTECRTGASAARHVD